MSPQEGRKEEKVGDEGILTNYSEHHMYPNAKCKTCKHPSIVHWNTARCMTNSRKSKELRDWCRCKEFKGDMFSLMIKEVTCEE